MSGSRKMLLMMGLVMMMVMVGEGQYVPSCSIGLAPCLDYINSITPPPISCCKPLKDLVTNDISCLCDLYTNPSILQALGLNITNALRLTRLCSLNNIPFSQLCNTTYALAPAPSSTSIEVKPPATPGADGADVGGARRVVLKGLLFLPFFWTSILFT